LNISQFLPAGKLRHRHTNELIPAAGSTQF
jgi:hypothetical protein